ncbi:MAG: N-acetyltransferase GCN5 [Candidatus Nomurabacteria bacterium GW2011_GWB1_37_5]|uniref:N-acetyltransferase GCN5 n=1 Tax=Candidatus Nomurabacteria bacterium GW2011_GWB1_37_5 TaxID=1618742 RepID=A0A0G0K533_9BACT|nr:MAG: N-acetyltransferase GCN5 [Candidatus Nomurabacteria bacterium GW2011_GWB1_37_5]
MNDLQTLIDLEKSVPATNVYSPALTMDDWKDEFEKGEVYLIKKDDDIVGNISYEKKSDDHVYVSGILVDYRFQGQGIAKEALNQVLEKFRNIKRIDLVTHPDNPAINLYQSFGFSIESRIENYYGDGQPRLRLVLNK